jgi:hypothetical protein
MVDAARWLGKAVREVRRMTSDLPGLILDEDEAKPSEARVAHRSARGITATTAGDRPGVTSEHGSQDDSPRGNDPTPGAPLAGQDAADEGGRVAFRPATKEPPKDTEPPQKPEQP